MAKVTIRNKSDMQSLKLKRKMQEQKEQITELKQYIDVLKTLLKEKFHNGEAASK